MKRLGATLVFAVLLIGVATVAVGSVSAQDETTMTVSVTDSDGNPIQGAEVTAEWDGGENSGITRSNGNTLIDVPADVEVEVSVTHPDYVQNLPVEVDDPTEQVDVQMAEPGTIVVTVVDADGDPLEDVRVRARHLNDRIVEVVSTNSDGVAQLSGIEQRTYIVDTNRPGYIRNETRIDLDRSVRRQTLGVETKNVEIEFIVRDSYRDRPLEGATIRINGSPEGTTASDGTQVTRRGVNDNYEVTAEKEGYESQTRRLRVVEQSIEGFTFEIRRTPSISIEPQQTAVVAGQQTQVIVSNAYADRVSGATILLNDQEVAETDSQGVATFYINETGDNTVRAESDGRVDTETIEGISPEEPEENESADDQPEPEDDSDDGGSDSVGDGFGVIAALAAVVGLTVVVLGRRRE